MLGWVNRLLGGRPWERELKRVQQMKQLTPAQRRKLRRQERRTP